MVFDAYTSYPNQFLTIDQSVIYTKHYYSGAQRIAGKVIDNNPNGFDVGTSAKMAASSTGFNFDALRQKQLKDLQMYLDKASGEQKKFTVKFAPYKTYAAMKAEEELAEEQDGSTDKKTTMSFAEKLYYFHPDHLGSSTYLTDANGDAYQFFLNLPFGETMAEGRNINEDFETPYKFNGKELDPETGMYYYGARFYDPKLSIWMSVDPMAEQRPNMSPYNYCSNNPINRIDPTGMLDTDLFNTDGKKIGTDGVDNGVKMVVKKEAEANQIAKTVGNIDLSTVKSGVILPSDAILGESLNVLDRGIKNGGYREESSIVGFDGRVLQGATGPMPSIDASSNMATAPADLPSVAFNEMLSKGAGVSIHFHPTESLISGSQYFSFSASVPTAGVDDATWSSHNFRTNIIVGRLGQNQNPSIVNGRLTDYRQKGAAIYHSGSLKPVLELTSGAIRSIIKGGK